MNAYTVWCPELGSGPDDGREIKAGSPDDAACTWGQREDCDSADYWIIQGQGTTVMVRHPDGTDHQFRVTGESMPTYFARSVA